jgi:3-deoxy-manno-octulosonate cytidylyltransferase (CMP-KDO synthetase)
MNAHLKIGVIIPARMASERLPGKPLLDVLGLPMIEHVRRRAMLSSNSNNVIVASGDSEILAVTEKNGGVGVLTVQEHVNGLSRVSEVAERLDFTHIIVLQGDEILINPEALDALSSAILSRPGVDFWNGVSPLEIPEELDDSSVVKCTQKNDQTIQTLFRKSPLTAPISIQMQLVKKINGLFAISKDFLSEVVAHSATAIESAESIEQMRILELSRDIAVFDMQMNYPSINLPTDVPKVLSILSSDSTQAKIFSQIKNMQ